MKEMCSEEKGLLLDFDTFVLVSLFFLFDLSFSVLEVEVLHP